MKRRHAHLLRAAVLAAAAVAAWWYLTDPASVLTASWAALGWALIAAELGAWLAARTVTFFAGPAWWCALVTNRARAAWRHWRHGHGHGRPHIPDRLRRWVYAADRYRCVRCGYAQNEPCLPRHGCAVACGKAHSLQFEHVRPFSRGGLTSLFNGISLCPHCNVIKSDYWVYGNGRAYYHGLDGATGEREAAAVLAAGLLARRSPARLARLMVACLAG